VGGVTRSSSRFSAVPQPSVSLFRRFCDTKTPGWQNLVFWTQNQQRTHHKVGTTRPHKANHTTIYAKGACLYTHRATDNRHIECTGLPWWSFGLRRARIVCRGSTHTFCTKRMDDPCTPRAERPPRQPRTRNVTVVGCSMGLWARTLRVDRSMDGFRGPSGAHFVVCSLLVLGPKYQILPSRRFWATETPEKRETLG
jgi:hypothetical protein